MKLNDPSGIRGILSRVISSRAKIKVEDVSPNGDMMFSAHFNDIGIVSSDLKHPIMRARFFVNFVGELLVRCNAQELVSILVGFDAKLYDKIIGNCKHTDFGMFVDNSSGLIKWQMHISHIQQILTEDYGRILDGVKPASAEDDDLFAPPADDDCSSEDF